MKPKDFVGNEAISSEYGLVFVDSAPKRSKAMVNITVIQRGKGWDEATETYRKYRIGSFKQKHGGMSIRWAFTHRDEYGTKDKVHINTLDVKF